MPAKKHHVRLTSGQEKELKRLLRVGKHPSRTIIRARVLLRANDGWTDGRIATALDVSETTPRDIRKRFANGGLDRALYDAPRSGQPEVLSSEEKAKITAIACTDPPDGYGRWTLDLLVERVADTVKDVGRSTIHRVLLQSDLKPWREKNVVHSND